MQPPQGPGGPPGYGGPQQPPYGQQQPQQPYGQQQQPPYGAPGFGQPQPGNQRGKFMKGGGAGCGVAAILLLIGFVLIGIGSTNRRMREATPVGILVVLLAVVPGLLGGGLLIVGFTKKS